MNDPTCLLFVPRQFYCHSPLVPVADVALMELLREHQQWEKTERQRELIVLGLASMVACAMALCFICALLVLIPSLPTVWLVFVPLDLCGLVFLLIRFFFSRNS